MHLHTKYSFLDGAIKIEELKDKVIELGMGSIAITDHGNMFGVLDFYHQMRSIGVKPILGMEAYVTTTSRYTDKIRDNYHLVLLAETRIGYHNLIKLSSKSFLYGKYYFPRVDKRLLYEHREGIIALSACMSGEVGRKCTNGDPDDAMRTAIEFRELFGSKNYFLEIQPNGLPEQDVINQYVFEFASEIGVKTVCTNDCHYLNKSEHDAQNVLMAIRQQKSWGELGMMMHKGSGFYVKSEEEMWLSVKDDYASSFEGACEVAKRCTVDLTVKDTFLPPFELPKRFTTESEYLIYLSRTGLDNRLSEVQYEYDKEEYSERLEKELDIVTRMGFSGYFLIVQDFINWAKNDSIKVGPGRGSGAGSLLAYALRITDLDPIPYGLIFERFLNPNRISYPDFDVDFMQERRDEVMAYITRRYGGERVGQIATYSALSSKSAIKDAARIFRISFSEINNLTKDMPLLLDGKKLELDQAVRLTPRLAERAAGDPVYQKIMEVAKTLDGLCRQAGMHAAGLVVGKDNLMKYVPIFTGPNGEYVTQFDKKKIESTGLVKFDLLGLKTLDIVCHAEALVNRLINNENKLSEDLVEKAMKRHMHFKNRNVKKIPKLAMELLDPSDLGVYDLISNGDTMGIFQFESAGFRELCRRLKPNCFEDITAACALYRPGPMQSGMVDDFIERKHGIREMTYPHPSLEKVLRTTYGSLIYQEQILLSLQVIGGYSLGEADLIRRAMGKKDFKEMAVHRANFIQNAIKTGLPEKKAGEVFIYIEKFAGYGFNKSHAAAYSMITYQTAYLKYFYPAEFIAALLTASPSSEEVVIYIKEAKKDGISVLTPDINRSDKGFIVEYKEDRPKGMIRFGIEAIKGIGGPSADHIIGLRNKHGEFDSIENFCERALSQGVNKKGIEALVKGGAFDFLETSRKHELALVKGNVIKAQSLKKDEKIGQLNMFSAFKKNAIQTRVRERKRYQEFFINDLLKFEHDSLGVYLSGHPLSYYEKEINELDLPDISEIKKLKQGTFVETRGVMTSLKERNLKKGEGKWALGVLEDTSGQLEVLCLSKVYRGQKKTLINKNPILISGTILHDEVEDGNKILIKLRLQKSKLISEIRSEQTKKIKIEISVDKENSSDDLTMLFRLFRKYEGSKEVEIILRSNNINIKKEIKNCEYKVNPIEEFVKEAHALESVEKIELDGIPQCGY